MNNHWEIQTVEFDKTNSEGNVDLYGYGQISILLSKYVLKEKGKGLSSNDFTDSDKLKLNSVEVNAQENKVETISINGGQKFYPDSEKNISIDVPTKLSQLYNDVGYAKLINTSTQEDYSDSYVGKAKLAFQDEENIPIGKNSNAEQGGIALGANTSTDETHDVNINNQLLHNKETDLWEGIITHSKTSDTNTNGTNLNQLDVVIDDLETETQNRIDGDNTLLEKINTETQTRTEADDLLRENLNSEIQERTEQDELFEINLNNEIYNRNLFDTNLSNRIDSIDDLIPNQASSSNQLADKSFVNSTVQTNTANFRGNWDDWADVPSNSEDYPQDYSGNTTPTVNDYLVVQDASDYTLETLSGTWRFKYTGDWETDGKNGWIAEYQVNEEPFTSEQLYAINSGITSEKVAQYDEFISSGSGDVTGVKGEAETTYRHGDVNITKANLGLTDDEMGMVWYDSNVTSGKYTAPYYADGIWVIAIINNASGITGIKYSTDGKTWYNSLSGYFAYSDPYYANGIWIISVTTNEGSGAGIRYSTDGKTWWTSSSMSSLMYNTPHYANGIWVIGGIANGIKYSTNGTTWYNSNITINGYDTPYYANGIWVIGSDGASGTATTGIKYSTDGKTWSDSNITSGGYKKPCYANGIWVIGGTGIKYSTDGKTWSDSNITSGGYKKPCYANGIWVIGGTGIKYSTDGKTWSDSNITSGGYKKPCYANGIWVITSVYSNGVKYSTDGKTWSDSNITSAGYSTPYYANGIWVIGTVSSNSDGIKYSTFNSLNDLGSAFKGITELSEKTTDLIEKTTNLVEQTSLYYGTCSTSRATNAKVVTCPTFELEIGCKIIVKFTDTAGSAPTSGNISLNINGTGDINLYNKNYTQMTYAYSGEFRANRLCEITYDGTYYIWLNYDSNTTYSTITQAEITAGTSTSSRLVTPKLLADNYNKKSSVTSHTLYL